MPQDASSSSLGGRGCWYTAEPSEPGGPRTKTYINRSWIRTSLGIPILEVSSAATPAWESSGCVIQTLFFSGSTRKICSSSVTNSFVNWAISRSTNSATTLGTESPARKRNTRECCVMWGTSAPVTNISLKLPCWPAGSCPVWKIVVRAKPSSFCTRWPRFSRTYNTPLGEQHKPTQSVSSSKTWPHPIMDSEQVLSGVLEKYNEQLSGRRNCMFRTTG